MDGTRGSRLLAIIPALLCAGCAVDPSDLIVRPDGSRLESVPGWRLRDVRTGQALHFLYAPDAPRTTPLGTVELRLTGRDDGRPAFARTPSMDVAYLGPTVGDRPHPDVAPLVDAFLQTVQRNDPGGLRLPSPPRYAQAPDAPAPGVPRAIDRLSRTAGLALVLAFLLALPWTVRALGRALGPADRRMLLILLGITAGAIALRLALPSRPVMHYMGYRLVQIAADLDPVPKYGAGALGLHHLLFRLTGPDHGAAIALHKVLGGLAAPVAAALMAALGAPRRAVLTGALLAAFTPLLVKDATSESLGVPALLWTLAGLALAARARTTARPLDGALALLPLSLAAMSRPEAIALVPLAALATWAVAPGPAAPVPRTRAATIAWLALGGVATALLALRAVQAALAVGTELSLGNAPQLVSWGGVQAVLTGTLLRNAAFWPSLFPTVITVGAFAAPFLVERRMRAPVLVLGGIGLAWIALAQLDLPYVSIPRVQAPGLAFVALAGAWGLSVPASKWPVRMTGRVRTAGMIAGVAILLLSAAATVPTLWLRSGADDEEALLRDARAALPDGPVTIVRRGYGDPPREPAHLDWPDTWFAPPFRDDRVTGIAAFLADPRFDRPVYFLAGLRCHLRACGAQGPHPACVEMARRFRLEPVLEREVPLRTLPIDRPAQGRHADQDFGWCHDGPGPFRIGLYRVLPAGE